MYVAALVAAILIEAHCSGPVQDTALYKCTVTMLPRYTCCRRDNEYTSTFKYNFISDFLQQQ